LEGIYCTQCRVYQSWSTESLRSWTNCCQLTKWHIFSNSRNYWIWSVMCSNLINFISEPLQN